MHIDRVRAATPLEYALGKSLRPLVLQHGSDSRADNDVLTGRQIVGDFLGVAGPGFRFESSNELPIPIRVFEQEGLHGGQG